MFKRIKIRFMYIVECLVLVNFIIVGIRMVYVHIGAFKRVLL